METKSLKLDGVIEPNSDSSIEDHKEDIGLTDK